MNSEMEITVFHQDKQKVERDLREGKISYMGFSKWTFADYFFAFLLSIGFFDWCERTYPTPRIKKELPIWFLIACAIQMRLHTTSSYHKLPGILGSGSILTRLGFNVGGFDGGGFNYKNRKKRTAPLHFDAVRKFFKDTDVQKLRNWYNIQNARFLHSKRAFDKHGIFILDQTHVVVPDNTNYTDAVWMAVDEHGQRIDTTGMTDEQKKVVRYRLTYAMSELLHVSYDENTFIIAGYQWDSGKTDELVQGRPLVDDFIKAVGKNVMKLLIVDRGFIDGTFIEHVKLDLHSDVLIPMRSNMDITKDAIRLMEAKEPIAQWRLYRNYSETVNKNGSIVIINYTEEIAYVGECGIWDECNIHLYTSLMRTQGSDGTLDYWALVCTKEFDSEREPFDLYAKRVTIEDRHKQLKNVWMINEFSSPNKSLIESHVAFTLHTYTLVQLFLTKEHLSDLTRKTIETLQLNEQQGTDQVVIYSGDKFAVFNVDVYSKLLLELNPEANERFKSWIARFQANDRMRTV